jgi:hypothetical protein
MKAPGGEKPLQVGFSAPDSGEKKFQRRPVASNFF